MSPGLGLHSLAASEGDAGLVESLGGVERHPELVPEPEEEEAALQVGEETLSDELLEALSVELPPHLADSLVPGALLGQLEAEQLLGSLHVWPAGSGHLHHLLPLHSVLLPHPGWEYREEDGLHWARLLLLLLPLHILIVLLLVVLLNAPADQSDRRVVFHQSEAATIGHLHPGLESCDGVVCLDCHH